MTLELALSLTARPVPPGVQTQQADAGSPGR